MNKDINLKINFKKMAKKFTGQDSTWQKSLFLSVVIGFLFFIAGLSYLVFRPLDIKIKNIVEEDIKSIRIIFDKKTLDELKRGQQPAKPQENSTIKNPFLSF